MSDVIQYKCPCCGGALEFNSYVQKMKCPYCDTEFDLEAMKQYDEGLRDVKQPDEMKWDDHAGGAWKRGETDHMSVYTCGSCGGEIIADENTGATSCPYCGNPVVMTGRFSGALRPDYVIPFKLDREAAKEKLNRHFKGKWLLPKVFKDQNHIEEIKGVYVPFWLFDAQADAEARYRATRVRTWSDPNYVYTETTYYAVERAGNMRFENVPADGSSQMPDDLMESIEPFDFSEAVDFQTAYLAGYLADKYDVTAAQSIERANQRIRTSAEKAIASTVMGYATVIPEGSNVRLHNAKTKYALYPVWLLTTSWKGRHFLFAMNGQTGKFVGDLPVDNGAYWRWFAILTAVCGAAAYLIRWLTALL